MAPKQKRQFSEQGYSDRPGLNLGTVVSANATVEHAGRRKESMDKKPGKKGELPTPHSQRSPGLEGGKGALH